MRAEAECMGVANDEVWVLWESVGDGKSFQVQHLDSTSAALQQLPVNHTPWFRQIKPNSFLMCLQHFADRLDELVIWLRAWLPEIYHAYICGEAVESDTRIQGSETTMHGGFNVCEISWLSTLTVNAVKPHSLNDSQSS
jgi:hypothetical protein